MHTTKVHIKSNPSTGRTTTIRDDAPIVTFETYQSQQYKNALTNNPWKRHPIRRADYAIAVACFALALIARWPFVAAGETLLHSDEAIVGLMAQDIANGDQFPIYFYGQRYMGALEAYTVAAFSAVFDQPIHALRFAPAFYLALIVVTQYFMLTRWFGRAGGAIGALALIACSPMLMQWTISARGGYVEIMLWGSMLLFTYTEWFLQPGTQKKGATVQLAAEPKGATGQRAAERKGATGQLAASASRHKFIFGAIIGSGMWINPSIVLFIAPIIIHALANKPLNTLWQSNTFGPTVERFSNRARYAALPIVAFIAVLILNFTWATWVEDGRVQSLLLLGLVPKFVAVALLAITAFACAAFINRRIPLIDRARSLMTANAPMVLGLLAGATPAMLYVASRTITGQPLDPSLPLGFRPIWMAGETLIYLANGLPILFGPDPRGFLSLVSVGRDTVAQPLSLMMSGVVNGAGWLALGAVISTIIAILRSQRFDLAKLFRLQPHNHGPATLLLIGVATTVGLYLLGGCVLDFTTIRYLIPLLVFVPGLLAAAFVNREWTAPGKLGPLALCTAWAIGQFAMHQQLGARHPLSPLADQIQSRNIQCAVAEPLDAHLLSYLTQQNCKTIEFESFWPRLAHYFPLVKDDQPMDYIVQTKELDREWDWIKGNWPGESPPETKRFLWPRIRSAMIRTPDIVLHREPLCDGYEWIRLRTPLPDRNIQETVQTRNRAASPSIPMHSTKPRP